VIIQDKEGRPRRRRGRWRGSHPGLAAGSDPDPL
jgi:hypothetical protein